MEDFNDKVEKTDDENQNKFYNEFITEADKFARNGFNKESNIATFKFSKYNNPQPREISGKEWIYWGKDNLLLQYWSDLYKKSSTHNSLVNMAARQVAGEGWMIEDGVDMSQKDELDTFMHQAKGEQTYNEVLRRISLDLQLAGAFAIGVVWSEDFSEISYIYHVDITEIRIHKDREETIDGTIFSEDSKWYWYSKNWRQPTKPKFKPRRIAKFSRSNKIDHDQLIYVRRYVFDTKFYGLPRWVGASNYVEVEYELSNMILNSLKKGLSPSLLISLNDGTPPAEKREEMYRSIRSLYAGTDRAGEFILTWAKDKASAPSITPIQQQNLNELYGQIADMTRDFIVSAHGITDPSLAGISTPGKLGGSNDIARAQELYANNVIYPDQILIEETFNEKILPSNGFKLKISIKDSQPISYQMADATLLQILTIDELRKKIGYVAMSDKDKAELGTRNGWTSDGGDAPPTGEKDKPGEPSNKK